MAKILISGVTGSLGRIVLNKLLTDESHKIIGYSRDELKQSEIEKHPRLTLFLGDIRDQRRLIEASRGVDTIFHFAALKRVDTMEENPEECIATNVEGTENILGAQRMNKIFRVVLASTDKAAHPETVYGACKLLSERLVLRNPNNVVCRYGNVLASRGSVVQSFVKSLLEQNTIFLTDLHMTRFFLTLDQASDFVLSEGLGQGGGLKIPIIKACKILDLAKVIADILEVKSPQLKIIGIRNAEKIHECMATPYDGVPVYSNTAEQYTKQGLRDLVAPIVSKIIASEAFTKRAKLKVVREAQA